MPPERGVCGCSTGERAVSMAPLVGGATALLVVLLAADELRKTYRPGLRRSPLLILELPLLALVLALFVIRFLQLV
jgi:hypothetical protein